jgi:hypothetical protein
LLVAFHGWGGERWSVEGRVSWFVVAFDPWVVEELFDSVSSVGVDGKEMRYKVLSWLGDVVPPWRKEGVLSLCNLLGENLNTLVVEWREAAK